jgi:hypothetical protein
MSVLRAESRRFTPFDLLLVAGVVTLAVFLIMSSIAKASGPGETAIVEVNGHEVIKISLLENRDYTVEGFRGKSSISVRDGQISMTDSDCPDKLCVKMGWISNNDTSVICLPNRVVIRITGTGSFDTISK